MAMKRSELLAFCNHFSPSSGTATYDDDPWSGHKAEELSSIEDTILKDFDCSSFDLFCPVRDPRLVASDLSVSRTTLSGSGLMEDLSCPICMGICKEVMVVKDCSHRFCRECIQKWLRNGHQVCPQCRAKIPSRRALRHDDIFDAVIERLFSDVEKFEREREQVMNEMNKQMNNISTNSIDEPPPPPFQAKPARRGRPPNSSRSIPATKASPQNRLTKTSLGSTSLSERSSAGEPNSEGNKMDSNFSPSPSSTSSPSSSFDADGIEEDDMEDHSGFPSSKNTVTNLWHHSKQRRQRRSHFYRGIDDIRSVHRDPVSSGEDSQHMYFEVFLVCLNHNLPPAVCSMARELSKRPMKFPVTSTTRDVAEFLADRLIRDVLGSYDVIMLINDLSFVREGEFWPAASGVPLPEVCRAVTESLGPTVLRYILSDRLFAACDRASMSLCSRTNVAHTSRDI